MSDFSTRTYGKWIFSGEHSVLRGGPALVFPLFKKKLELHYTLGPGALVVDAIGENASDIMDMFPGVLEKALEILNRNDEVITGRIKFTNELPLGSGMGASSSLCVGFSRWFHYLGFVKSDEIYEFARQLENIFHGESSGVDIAVVLHEKALVFKRPNLIETLNIKNNFKLYLSHTGQKGITKECVNKVNAFIKADPIIGLKTDEKMIQTTKNAIQLFMNSSNSKDTNELIEILNSGYECFKIWGLTEGAVDAHINFLKSQGALAAKPTGSGGGGYVLSLWPDSINRNIGFEVIELFE
ncbi:MAG: hypothetical protein JNL11_08350 [Bdellovibrionaceae bacterium]|nr:hypothetical protein [Pseudobdellovibrionaceae bacterium]